MRITTLLTCVLAGSLLFSGCTKSDSDALPTNYRIDGVQDMTLQASSGQGSAYGTMYLTVNATGKIQERVSLSFQGVPAGCGATLSSVSGFPNFYSTVTFNDTNASGGTYPVKLICDGSVTGRKSYTFNLTLPTLPDCSAWLLRSYTATNSCGSGNSYSELLTASGIRNRINFNNFENTGTHLYADILCQSTGYNINMPSQTVNGVTYYGYGYANSSYIYIYYTRQSSAGTYSCTMNLY